jgi:hypothetical protein
MSDLYYTEAKTALNAAIANKAKQMPNVTGGTGGLIRLATAFRIVNCSENTLAQILDLEQIPEA